MRASGIIARLIAGLAVASCAGEPVVGDIGQDKVRIVANGASEYDIQSRADQACGMYQRDARFMSFQCADGYCIQKVMLFACVPRVASTSVESSAPAYQPVEAQVYCSFPNSPNPNLAKTQLSASACAKSGGTNLGSAASPDADRVMCMFPNLRAPVNFPAKACTQGGGRITGPAV